MSAVFEYLCALFAGNGAGSASYALIFRIKKLGLRRFRLGVMTPRAVKRTALDENRRSDTGAVVYAKLLNVKNTAIIESGISDGDKILIADTARSSPRITSPRNPAPKNVKTVAQKENEKA